MPDDQVDADHDSADPVPTPGTTTTTDADTSEAGPTKKSRRTPLWAETLILLVVALAMALVIKTFFVQAFYIPSESMEPGLIKNDRILVEKPSYWFGGGPQRGDVIVFKDPGGWLSAAEETEPGSLLAKGLEKIGLYPSGGHLVKRVIGLPGDKIQCCDDQGRLMINGVAVDESDFARRANGCDGPMPSRCASDWTVERVPDDMYFVMGDNRGNSADSSDRLCGANAPNCDQDRAFVPEDDVVGKVFALVWPLSRGDLIGRPDDFDKVPDPTS